MFLQGVISKYAKMDPHVGLKLIFICGTDLGRLYKTREDAWKKAGPTWQRGRAVALGPVG
jgi:hypothetical protein